jgi:glutamate-ammonia-ligase adenylyltransferase
MISALTALTAEGRLYEVDMRLRPSGTSGPIAVTLQRFADYQRANAWTWEHLALTRARVVVGPAKLQAAIEAAVADVLTAPRDADKLFAEVAEMRRRIDKEYGTDEPWNLKYVRGGLVDIDFIAQSLQLAHGARHPTILSRNTATAYERIGAAGVLAAPTAERLANAARMLGNAHFLLRLCTAGNFTAEAASADLEIALAEAVGAPNFATAHRILRDTQAFVRATFEELFDRPAAGA